MVRLTITIEMCHTSLTRIACYVRNWSVLRSLPVQAFATLSLLWYSPSRFTRCRFRNIMPGVRFSGNSIYRLFAYFVVSSQTNCIPSEFPANLTALVDNISSCVQRNDAKIGWDQDESAKYLIQCDFHEPSAANHRFSSRIPHLELYTHLSLTFISTSALCSLSLQTCADVGIWNPKISRRR